MSDDNWTHVDTALYVLFFIAAYVVVAYLDGAPQ